MKTKKPPGASRASGVPFRRVRYTDVFPRDREEDPLVDALQGKPRRPCPVVELGPRWVKEAGDLYHSDMATIFEGEVRLPIIYHPGAFIKIESDSTKRGDPSVVERQQLKEEAIMDFNPEKAKNPEISSTEILEETLKHVRQDRDIWERRGAIHRVTEAKLKAQVDQTLKKIEKEAADNVFLEEMLFRVVGPLRNNHRASFATKPARDHKPDSCPTCALIHDVEVLLEKRRGS